MKSVIQKKSTSANGKSAFLFEGTVILLIVLLFGKVNLGTIFGNIGQLFVTRSVNIYAVYMCLSAFKSLTFVSSRFYGIYFNSHKEV